MTTVYCLFLVLYDDKLEGREEILQGVFSSVEKAHIVRLRYERESENTTFAIVPFGVDRDL